MPPANAADLPTNEPQRTRVMIVDDHAVARMGLSRLLTLQPDMEVVGETENGAKAPSLYTSCKPDVVLMDVRMAMVDGIAATHTIRKMDPSAKVLMVSSVDSPHDIELAIEVGALGFVTKEAGPAELLVAIRKVAANEPYLPAGVREQLAAMKLEAPLNIREKQILRLLVEGMPLGDIAQRTSLSKGTVKVYICHILAKLKVSNRAEAVLEATRRGLVRVDD